MQKFTSEAKRNAEIYCLDLGTAYRILEMILAGGVKYRDCTYTNRYYTYPIGTISILIYLTVTVTCNMNSDFWCEKSRTKNEFKFGKLFLLASPGLKKLPPVKVPTSQNSSMQLANATYYVHPWLMLQKGWFQDYLFIYLLAHCQWQGKVIINKGRL